MMEAVQPRVVALIAAVSLAAGWLASTAVSQNVPSQPATGVSGPRPLGRQDAPAPYTQQLRLKLQERPRSPSPGRNPFVFGARRPAPAPVVRGRQQEAVSSAVDAAPVAPIAPSLRFDLSGIAMNRQDGAEVFTAIVNDNGALVFVKAGDALSNGYKVVRVDETTVVIVDGSGVERTLRLK
jgi:hypothetical protein